MEDNISPQDSSEMPNNSETEPDTLVCTSESKIAVDGSNVCEGDNSEAFQNFNEAESSSSGSSAPVSSIPSTSHPRTESSSIGSSIPVSSLPSTSHPRAEYISSESSALACPIASPKREEYSSSRSSPPVSSIPSTSHPRTESNSIGSSVPVSSLPSTSHPRAEYISNESSALACPIPTASPKREEYSSSGSSPPVSPIPTASYPRAESSSSGSSAPVSPIPTASHPPLPCFPSVGTWDPHNYPYSGLQVRFPTIHSYHLNSAECGGKVSPGGTEGVKVILENEDLWAKFSEEGTEMLVAKSGRRMFPQVKISVTGLNPDIYYFLMLDMIRADEMKYRFSDRRWKEGQRSKEPHSPTVHVHRHSPCLGRHWMDKPVVFENVRLTNDSKCRTGEILLSSKHKYVVRVHIIAGSDISQLYHKPALSFTLRQTSFIAVTTYQNERLKKLKIENNPSARRLHKKRNSLRRSEESNSSRENSPDSSEWAKPTESKHTSTELQNLVAMAERMPPVSPIFHQLHEPAIRAPEWPYTRPLSIITDFDSRPRNVNNARYPVYQRYHPYPSTSRCSVPVCNMFPPSPWPYDPYALQWYYYNMLSHQQYPSYPDSTMRPEQQCHVTSSGLE